jgi:hypothetical protein
VRDIKRERGKGDKRGRDIVRDGKYIKRERKK